MSTEWLKIIQKRFDIFVYIYIYTFIAYVHSVNWYTLQKSTLSNGIVCLPVVQYQTIQTYMYICIEISWVNTTLCYCWCVGYSALICRLSLFCSIRAALRQPRLNHPKKCLRAKSQHPNSYRSEINDVWARKTHQKWATKNLAFKISIAMVIVLTIVDPFFCQSIAFLYFDCIVKSDFNVHLD